MYYTDWSKFSVHYNSTLNAYYHEITQKTIEDRAFEFSFSEKAWDLIKNNEVMKGKLKQFIIIYTHQNIEK